MGDSDSIVSWGVGGLVEAGSQTDDNKINHDRNKTVYIERWKIQQKLK